jgi:hypothetical protein
MPKLLSEKQISDWDTDGCIFPFSAVPPAEAITNLKRFLALEKDIGEEPQNRFKIKAHLPFPWMWNIIRNDTILDAVEDLIGPNILCWGSSFFCKQANDARYVSWHQDSTYYGLSERATVTVWYAFTESKVSSGCMQYIPGTHNLGQIGHEEMGGENNLLMRGQTIQGVDEDFAVNVELQPGEFSIHHESVVHGSSANGSPKPRIGLSIHYIAPHVHQLKLQDIAAASLVRGEDVHGHWGKDPEPAVDFDPACLAALDASYGAYLTGEGKL